MPLYLFSLLLRNVHWVVKSIANDIHLVAKLLFVLFDPLYLHLLHVDEDGLLLQSAIFVNIAGDLRRIYLCQLLGIQIGHNIIALGVIWQASTQVWVI